MRRIVIVEDEPDLRANYSDALKKAGFAVDACAGVAEANHAFDRELPDMAIVDVGLGDDAEGGFELVRGLRQRSETLPIIFLTARDSDLDVISGLRLGADEYLSKDMSLMQLLARVHALFRRLDSLLRVGESSQGSLQRGDLALDQDRMQASWKGVTIELSVTEFWMLSALAKRPGHVRTRDQLMRDADTVIDEQTVNSHIKRIRRKFEKLDSQFDAIETIYGMGYRWRSTAP